MDIKTFMTVAPNLPEEISVLIQGPTGIGKSHLVKQIGKEKDLSVIDRRLSQMSEGDMIGLPELQDGVTRFCPPDWYAKACKEPCILFMDELNRATPEVMQAAFQIVLDRELNGHRLHPQTRVFAAINVGSEYEVNEMDPALLRRFWSIELEPTKDDWVEWARGRVSGVIIDFINQHPEHLRAVKDVEPGKVAPNPASWERVDISLRHIGIVDDPNHPAFYPTALGMVGAPAAIAFTDFARNYEQQISAEDILDNFDQHRHILEGLPNDKLNALIEKIKNHCADNVWSVTQADNVARFVKLISDEMMVSLWNAICATQKLENIRQLHAKIGRNVVEAVNISRKTS